MFSIQTCYRHGKRPALYFYVITSMDYVCYIFFKVTGLELKPVDWRVNISKYISLNMNPFSSKWQMVSRPIRFISDVISAIPAELYCLRITLTTALCIFLKKINSLKSFQIAVTLKNIFVGRVLLFLIEY